MPLPDDLQIIFTSADGTQRRRVPRIALQVPSWQIERYGGYGQCTVPTAINFTVSTSILLGDRVEIFYQGIRQYRGYVSSRQKSVSEPRKTTFVCYGAYFWLRKVPGKKNYAFPINVADASDVFAAFATDALIGAKGPQGVRLIASVQALHIGTLEQSLETRGLLTGDVIDSLMQRCGNLAIWGVDVDDAGSNRLYIRPTSAAYPPTHMLPVPSRNTEAGDSEEQGGDVVNELWIVGGSPRFPNLIHNGSFDLPTQAGGDGTNLVLNGGFEVGSGHTATNWTFTGGASREQGKNSPPAVISAFLGNAYIELDNAVGTESADQSAAASFTAGHQYIFSFRAAKEIELQTLSGHAVLNIKDGGGTILTPASTTITIVPSLGNAWDYFSYAFTMPAGAASYQIQFVLDSITPRGGQLGGLCIDDVQLYDSQSLGQDGWYVNALGTPAEVIAVNWTYPSDLDGGYCVFLDAISSNLASHDLKLSPSPGNRFKVVAGQSLRMSVWLKAAPANAVDPNPPLFFLEIEWYDGSGNKQFPTTTSTLYSRTRVQIADWTLFELTATIPANASTADANITWRGTGSLLVDQFIVSDAAGPDPATSPSYYQADGPVTLFIPASGADLAAFRTSQGLGVAPYVNSETLYGPQADVVRDDSIIDFNGAMAVADAVFSAKAVPYFRPTVRILGDTRHYWPGETVSLQGTDGPSLAPSPLPIARMRGTYEQGTLKISLEPFKEQPDPILVYKRLIQEQLRKFGGGSNSSGGGYSNPSGGSGGAVTADNKTKVDANDTSPGYLGDKMTVLAGDLVQTIVNPGAAETLNHALATSGVGAGTYGGGSTIPQVAIDAKGRATSAANITIIDNETPGGTPNGVLVNFSLAHPPAAGSVRVYLGVSATTMQRLAETQFSVAGSTLTFTAAPATGSVIRVEYRY